MKRILICMAVMAMMLYACSTGSHKELPVVDSVKAADSATSVNAATAAGETPVGENDQKTQDHSAKNKQVATVSVTPVITDAGKKIIRTANITLELANFRKYDAAIRDELKNYGAYIAEEEQESNETRKGNTMTIKVRVDQFDALINAFLKDSVQVIEKKVSSTEVSAEMVDTQLRLESKKQMRDRYLGLLKEAKNMKEILQVQQEINSIQEEMESAEGKLNFLRHQTTYSTIRLTYFQYLHGVPTNNVETVGFVEKLGCAFVKGLDIISGIVVFLVAIWPLLLVGLVVVGVRKRLFPKA